MIVGDRNAWVRDISLTAGLSLFYALLAPFGTNIIPLQQRLIQDFALGFSCMALLWPPMRLLLRLGDRAGLPELFVLIGGLILLTVPVSLVSVPILSLFQPTMAKGPGALFAGYFIILTMTLPGGVAYMMIERRLLNRPPAAAPSDAVLQLQEPPPWLSPRLGPDIVALQGEDHYVRVHTSIGSELLLMRLRDAIKDMEGRSGEQVHRSWWVAREAVGGVRANGRRVSLTLTNGLEVPVSREATARLRRAGWLG